MYSRYKNCTSTWQYIDELITSLITNTRLNDKLHPNLIAKIIARVTCTYTSFVWSIFFYAIFIYAFKRKRRMAILSIWQNSKQLWSYDFLFPFFFLPSSIIA